MASTRITALDASNALFLIHDLKPGGAERVFLTYVRSLQRIHAIPVLVRRDIELTDGVSVNEILDLGPRTTSTPHVMPIDVALGSVALFRKAARLRRLAERNHARLISTFLHKSHIIALTAKRFLDPHLLVAINVHELVSQHLLHHFPPTKRRMMAWFTRHYFPRADVIIAVAEGIKDDLVQNFGVPAGRIIVVPNPLDVGQIRERAREPITETKLQDARPLLIAVGRLVKLKGYDILLRAFAALPPALHAHLAFAGAGEEQARLAALAQELHIPERVHFLGFQENPWKYMRQADALVLSSLTEGFPNVIGEAMALGVPVVATRCSPGVIEYLEDGAAGVLTNPGNVDDLRMGLECVLTDAALRARLRERGPQRVLSFDKPRIIEQYQAVLEGLLHEARPSPRPEAPIRGPGRAD
jgi:glycosyltransferase involved in cell wall biosynthesis